MKKSIVLKLSVLAACLWCALNSVAQEAYAVYTGNDSTLTFYYDNNYNSRPGQVFIIYNWPSSGPDWSHDGTYNKVKKVVFKPSFADARPKSTYQWFYRMYNLESITGMNYLNTSKTTTMFYMFSGCQSLKNIDLSHMNTSKVTDMSSLFSDCRALTSIDVSNFDLTNVKKLYGMFMYCSGLTSINLSGIDMSHVEEMQNMFADCSGLTSLDVSGFNTESATNMGGMFANCTGLTDLDVSSFNTANVTQMGHMFSGCSGLTTLDVSNFNTANVRGMAGMFKGCSGLTSLDLSGFYVPNLNNINEMFKDCSGLTSLDLSGFDTRLMIDFTDTFNGCSSLTSLDLSNFNTNAVRTWSKTFYGCSSLTTISIGEQWNNIRIDAMDSDVFDGCTSLTSVICNAVTPPYLFSELFSSIIDNATLYVPKHSVEAYQANSMWNEFSDIAPLYYDILDGGVYYEITGENSLCVTHDSASSNPYAASVTVTIPDSIKNGTLIYGDEIYDEDAVTYYVTTIGERAFYKCGDLTSVHLPASVRSIGDYAFYQCSQLSGINFKDVDSIGNYSFAYCTSLANVKLKGDLQSILGTSFINCSSLKNYDHYPIHNSPMLKYKFVDGVIFTNNAADKTLVTYPCGKTTITYTIPDGTVNIGENAFRGNKTLKTVNMPTSLREIKNSAFNGCSKITGIEVPKGVTTIDRLAFKGCTALTHAVLPSTLTLLGASAFNETPALTFVGVKAQTPPTCQVLYIALEGRVTSFDQSHFTSVILGVPTGCKSTYKAAPIWQLFSTINEYESLVDIDVLTGDVDGDGNVGIADVTSLIDYILAGGNINAEAADVDGDGNIGIADVTTLIDMILLS